MCVIERNIKSGANGGMWTSLVIDFLINNPVALS